MERLNSETIKKNKFNQFKVRMENFKKKPIVLHDYEIEAVVKGGQDKLIKGSKIYLGSDFDIVDNRIEVYSDIKISAEATKRYVFVDALAELARDILKRGKAGASDTAIQKFGDVIKGFGENDITMSDPRDVAIQIHKFTDEVVSAMKGAARKVSPARFSGKVTPNLG